MAEKFNNYFSNVVETLNIPEIDAVTIISDHIADPIDQAIYKYSNHPSIIAIKEKCPSNIKFSFQNVTESEVLEVVMGLDSKKATVSQNIPTKLFKQNIHLYLHNITNIFNL